MLLQHFWARYNIQHNAVRPLFLPGCHVCLPYYYVGCVCLSYLVFTNPADGGGRYDTPPSLMLAAWPAHKAVSYRQCITVMCTCCFALQAYLLITKSANGGGRYNTPPSLMLAAWQAYKAAQEASLAAPATDLVQVSRAPPPAPRQDFARVLALLGIT
jgi:hypothetical protein